MDDSSVTKIYLIFEFLPNRTLRSYISGNQCGFPLHHLSSAHAFEPDFSSFVFVSYAVCLTVSLLMGFQVKSLLGYKE